MFYFSFCPFCSLCSDACYRRFKEPHKHIASVLAGRSCMVFHIKLKLAYSVILYSRFYTWSPQVVDKYYLDCLNMYRKWSGIHRYTYRQILIIQTSAQSALAMIDNGKIPIKLLIVCFYCTYAICV